MSDEPVHRWQLIRSEPGPDLILFHARFDWYKNPRNGLEFKRVALQAPNWVNVVAITPEQKIVVVRQFRFGVGHETTEIPAGMIEPDEPPEAAARRELEEETGYTTDQWRYLGSVEPNPAFLDNHCYTFLAQNVVKTHPPRPDEGEDILVEELTEEEMHRAVHLGQIRNALAVVALSHVFDLRGDWQSAPERK
ncbi:MAG: NUDIX hydrolase [Anaerolineae bacterium]